MYILIQSVDIVCNSQLKNYLLFPPLYYLCLKSGFTPLMFAVESGSVELVKLLLHSGAQTSPKQPVE